MPPSSSSFSLLLRHLSATPRRRHHHHLLRRHLSSSSNTPPSPPPTSSLSARLSFVFEKIDAIEKDRAHQDDALHRIRAWRQSKQIHQPPPPPPEQPPPESNNPDEQSEELGLGLGLGLGIGNSVVIGNKKEIQVEHPWPEWVALMEMLLKNNYFDNRRVDQNKFIGGLGDLAGCGNDNDDEINNININDNYNNINVRKFKERDDGDGDVDVDLDVDVDILKNLKRVHAALVNFGRDRFDVIRSLSKQDIQILVGYGCPSTDRKLLFSAKNLRKYTHLDEGDVCSSCNLRNTCDKAYIVPNKEDEAKTIDLMRVLLSYGFDPITGTVQNKFLLKQKTVKAVVRKLLREVVRLSAVPIDPNLPPPLIKKAPPKVKQPPPPPKRRVGRDDVEMKIGDWVCQKCNFMNFAKNTVCLQCDAKRPKRQLLPGEWECPQCDFLNYRRNMSCFNCEANRPPDGFRNDQAQRQNQAPARRERVPDREQVSNAWNFDFDDDESDGADVEAFENADPKEMDEDRHLDSPPDGNFSRSQEDYRAGQTPKIPGKEHSRPAQTKNSVGFDDFDDEDDDIDSYEVVNHNRNERQEASSVKFADVESDDFSGSENDVDVNRFNRRNSNSFQALRHNGASSDSEEDNIDYTKVEDLPIHPKWKSSHVADSGLRSRTSRGPSSQRRGFEEDDDGRDNYRGKGFSQKQGRGNFRDSDTRGFREVKGGNDGYISRQSRGNFRDSDDSGFSGDDEPNRNRGRGGFRGQQDGRSVNTNRGRGGRGGSGRSQRESYDGGSGRGRGQMGSFDRGMQNRSGRGGDRGHRRSDKTDDWSDPDSNRPLRQRRNVR